MFGVELVPGWKRSLSLFFKSLMLGVFEVVREALGSSWGIVRELSWNTEKLVTTYGMAVISPFSAVLQF